MLMEIEFNPSQLPAVRPPEAALKATSPSGAADSSAQTDASTLLSQLDAASATRADKVGELKPLGSNLHYPPEQLLERIAALLAVHFKN